MLSSTLLRTQSDARLVALAREGHERAFETIVERYRNPLHRYLRRTLPAVRLEDVLQQTFLGAWSSLRDGAEVRELRPWLYRIAHNAGANALKRSGYDYAELKESLRGSEGPEGDVERRAVMRETLAAVAGLPERQRRALLETAVEGRSQADVAREMGMSEGAVRQLVHRARTTLRAAATAITPLPMAGWAAGAGSQDSPATGLATRIAELVAGAGTAGVSATVAKTGAVVIAAGALATGPVGIVGGGSDHASGSRGVEAARSTTDEHAGGSESDRPVEQGPALSSSSSWFRGSGRRGSSRDRGEDRRGRGSDGKNDDRSGRGERGRRGGGGEDDPREDRSSRSGSGSSDGSSSGPGSGDSGGSSGSGSSGSGSSGSRSSGSGSSESESSGSGSSGSGSSGSGSSESESSGSGASGSGKSGSGSGGFDDGRSPGSGSSGSGDGSRDSDAGDG